MWTAYTLPLRKMESYILLVYGVCLETNIGSNINNHRLWQGMAWLCYSPTKKSASPKNQNHQVHALIFIFSYKPNRALRLSQQHPDGVSCFLCCVWKSYGSLWCVLFLVGGRAVWLFYVLILKVWLYFKPHQCMGQPRLYITTGISLPLSLSIIHTYKITCAIAYTVCHRSKKIACFMQFCPKCWQGWWQLTVA